MAKTPKYTEQFAFVGTVTQHEIVKGVAALGGYDKAPIVREAMDSAFGTIDGELAPGDTLDKAIERMLERMRAPMGAVENPAV